ncbi:PREDICTED: olfactory receptor 1019-like [Nanorana parkeri]|uniref:olfactory receptor 1019-like n=1 Tax=Nanorana parkeri TaxID=125878 RepID=UPI000854AD35|nr:PREDICTED: olfactory receptor 1019-like [Nanorana parkeri]
MKAINQTKVSEFVLSGLSDVPYLQLPLFLVFLLIYLASLVGNLLIVLLICHDPRLHTPMYLFLSNLAGLDIFYSSVTSPRMLSDLFSKARTITTSSCITQFYFFFSFICIELYLLAVMSYDRYIAICYPLHYIQIMHPKICAQMVSVAWVVGFLTSLIHTLCILRLNFCGPNVINSFFCDLPQLFLLSCNDTFINVLVMFLVGIVMGSGALSITFVPYIQIFRTIMGIRSQTGKLKAFSTCTSHLTVVFIFYGTLIFTYLRPNPTSTASEDRLVSIVYTVVTPLLNPLIYSLRNKDLKAALRRILYSLGLQKVNIE